MPTISTLLALVATVSAAPTLAQQFEPRPGLQALGSGATGVFEIGAVDIGRAETVLRALVHNGQILQVHGRRADEWLAKRNGSVGGKTISPTTLDELVHIAGGLDTDVRCGSSTVRADFARAADVVLLEGTTECRRATDPSTANPKGRSPAAVDGRRIDCSAISCSVSQRDATAPTRFQIKVDPGRATWGFEGYGIVAIWSLPDS
ncbi:MAG: hypothetical protein NDI84_04105 [Steroidobacteraceae bacterium]|nr:hypothetical protein [Steroidobacteraceae bacterium]